MLPAGQYDRRDDPVSGRKVVVAGTYRHVPAAPVGFFQMLMAVPLGLLGAASVIFTVFLAGGGFAVVDRTGALNRLMDTMVRILAGRGVLVIPIAGVVFAAGGAIENMQEELIPFAPVLLLLTRRLGFHPIVVVAMSMGPAAIGSAFGPMNPFQAGIAQKLAGLPLVSGWGFRLIVLAVTLALWLGWTMWFALRTRTEPAGEGARDLGRMTLRQGLVLAVVIGSYVMLGVGVTRLGWEIDQLTALFFLMGCLAGLIGGLGLDGTAEAFIEGFQSMAFAGLLIGFARGIYVVMEQGLIVDTVVNALFTPLSRFPVALSALGMEAVHAVVHVPVPSVSGQAVLTMPLLVPLSDLLGLSRQVTVLAYQCGAGLCELVTPTNGALMAMIAAAGVKFEDWLRFTLPAYAAMMILGAAAISLAIATGWK